MENFFFEIKFIRLKQFAHRLIVLVIYCCSYGWLFIQPLDTFQIQFSSQNVLFFAAKFQNIHEKLFDQGDILNNLEMIKNHILPQNDGLPLQLPVKHF